MVGLLVYSSHAQSGTAITIHFSIPLESRPYSALSTGWAFSSVVLLIIDQLV